MMFQVADNVPLPNNRQSYHELEETVKNLQIGQSFTVPNEANWRSQTFAKARKAGIKIVTKSDGNEIRVWRIED